MEWLIRAALAETPRAAAMDTVMALGAVASPWWILELHNVNEVLSTIAAAGGVVMLGLRIWAFCRWRGRDRDAD